jgi:hypothetical protein
MQWGDVDQACHRDYCVDSFGQAAVDSFSVFVGLSPEGRRIGLQTSSGAVELCLGLGDVAVLSSSVFHFGMANKGSCDILFFYLDRHSRFCLQDARLWVGEYWSDLGTDVSERYSVDICHSSGIGGLEQYFRVWVEGGSCGGDRVQRRALATSGVGGVVTRSRGSVV